MTHGSAHPRTRPYPAPSIAPRLCAKNRGLSPPPRLSLRSLGYHVACPQHARRTRRDEIQDPRDILLHHAMAAPDVLPSASCPPRLAMRKPAAATLSSRPLTLRRLARLLALLAEREMCLGPFLVYFGD